MIIIQNTVGKTVSEIRNTVILAIAWASNYNSSIWIHVEKEGREVAVNTDDDPIRPGMLAYENYKEGGIDGEPDGPKLVDALRELDLL